MRHLAPDSSSNQHHDMLVKLLLRNYASNLRRSWRNTPRAAFLDATIQSESLAMIILVFGFSLIETVLSRTIWKSLSLQVSDSKFTRGMLGVVVAGLICFWLVDRKLTRWQFVPGADKAYDTPRDRMLVWAYYATGLIIVVFEIAFSGFLKNVLPLPRQ